MKRILVLSAALLLVAGSALAQCPDGTLYEHQNEIGIYLVENPPADVPCEMFNYNGAPGSFFAYVVLTNPWNFNYGNAGVSQPISTVGGFEFKVVKPASAYLLNTILPPETANFATAPEFLCGTNIPVVDGHATLVTLEIGAFSPTPGAFYLTPVQDAPQSLAGLMAITDYNDYFRKAPAYSAAGSYDAPVFGLFQDVVPVESASFGAVKSMYR